MKWLRRLFAPAHRPTTPRRARPMLEWLEDRLVPTVTYHGGNLLTNVEVQGVYYLGEFQGYGVWLFHQSAPWALLTPADAASIALGMK
jgi:hypothetical protein